MSELWIVDTLQGDAEYVVSPGIVTERGDATPVSDRFARSLRDQVATLHVFYFDSNNNLTGKHSHVGTDAQILYHMRYTQHPRDAS